MNEIDNRIRTILSTHGRLPIEVASLKIDSDLYKAGLTSHASVSIMLAIEDEFDIEFPDSMLRKATFQSIASIETALRTIHAGLVTPADR